MVGNTDMFYYSNLEHDLKTCWSTDVDVMKMCLNLQLF